MATATATNESLSSLFGNYDSDCEQQRAMAKLISPSLLPAKAFPSSTQVALFYEILQDSMRF
jgi:hypothetical protein